MRIKRRKEDKKKKKNEKELNTTKTSTFSQTKIYIFFCFCLNWNNPKYIEKMPNTAKFWTSGLFTRYFLSLMQHINVYVLKYIDFDGLFTSFVAAYYYARQNNLIKFSSKKLYLF